MYFWTYLSRNFLKNYDEKIRPDIRLEPDFKNSNPVPVKWNRIFKIEIRFRLTGNRIFKSGIRFRLTETGIPAPVPVPAR